jgi:Flp pilus assembly protein TadG
MSRVLARAFSLSAMLKRRNAGDGGADKGAAAVEFALVVPILIVLLCGIIDYGLYFANALGVRSGVSEATRQLIVSNFSSDCDGFAASGSGAAVTAKIKDCVGPVAGTVDVKVKYNQWQPGNNITVCAVVDVQGVTGLTPMPNDGLVSALVVMPIQQPTAPTSSPPNPDNPSWFGEWCT